MEKWTSRPLSCELSEYNYVLILLLNIGVSVRAPVLLSWQTGCCAQAVIPPSFQETVQIPLQGNELFGKHLTKRIYVSKWHLGLTPHLLAVWVGEPIRVLQGVPCRQRTACSRAPACGWCVPLASGHYVGGFGIWLATATCCQEFTNAKCIYRNTSLFPGLCLVRMQLGTLGYSICAHVLPVSTSTGSPFKQRTAVEIQVFCNPHCFGEPGSSLLSLGSVRLVLENLLAAPSSYAESQLPLVCLVIQNVF